MSPLTLLLGTLTGICIATGIIFLFTGLRRPNRDRVQVLFALFAFSYGGANLTSLLEYKTTTLEAFTRIGDFTAISTVATLVFLLWFVSAYTKVTPRIFLWGLTLVFGIVLSVAVISPTSVHAEIFGIITATLLWGENITLLDATEGPWEILFFLSQLSLLGFLTFACIKQWRRGERQEASMLGLGLLLFILALTFDMLFIDSGAINFVYMGDYAFVPLLIIMSLQLSNQVIRTDEELASYRQNLEQMVTERTLELEETTKILQQTERSVRALLDAPPDTAMLVTVDGDILESNQIGASRLGLKVEDAIGKNLFDFFKSELAAVWKIKSVELLQKKQPMQWEDQREGRFYRNRMYPIINELGEIESVAIFAADITEVKRAENALQESEAKYRDLVEKISDVIYSLDLRGEVTYVSPAIENMIGYSPADIIGKHFSEFIPPDALDIVTDGLKSAISGQTSSQNEYWIATNIGEKRYVRVSSQPIEEDGQITGIQGAITDITEQKRLQESERESAAAEERSRLARDLHDAVTQTIYSASLIAEVLPKVWARNPEEGQRNLIKLRALVRGALAEMRTMLFELRPTALETANFETLLTQLGDALHGRTRIPVQIECDEIPDLPLQIKVAFYRIAQEAVNNIIKHAGATQTQIELKEQPEKILLQVRDNGRGFDPTTITNGGLGLGIMQERAENIRADFEVESQPGRGTNVTVIWKEPNQEENEVKNG